MKIGNICAKHIPDVDKQVVRKPPGHENVKEASPRSQLPGGLKTDKFPDGGRQTFGYDAPIRFPLAFTDDKDNSMNASPSDQATGENSEKEDDFLGKGQHECSEATV